MEVVKLKEINLKKHVGYFLRMWGSGPFFFLFKNLTKDSE